MTQYHINLMYSCAMCEKLIDSNKVNTFINKNDFSKEIHLCDECLKMITSDQKDEIKSLEEFFGIKKCRRKDNDND